MADIMISSIPHGGHEAQLLGLASELVRRGHTVTFVTTPRRAGQVRALGADALEYHSPLTGDDPSADRDEDLSAVLPRLLREAKAVLPVMEHEWSGRLPECVLVDVLAWGGTIFARKHRILDIQTWPIFASNEAFSLEQRYDQSYSDVSVLEEFYRDLTDFAEKAGSPDAADYLFTGADRNIVFMPREFQYSGDTFDERYVFVGPCPLRAGRAGHGERDWQVLVSMGTAHDRGPAFFRDCATALADVPGRVLMLTGGCVSPEDLPDLPANIEVRDWAEQFTVLERARAFVTHGGMNSVMEALYHAVPMVVIPDRVEQIANADRVAGLGLGLRIAGAGQLRNAVRHVMSDAAVRGRLAEMRAAVQAAGGAVAAADAVEKWMRG